MVANISDNAINILQSAVRGSTSIYPTIQQMNTHIILEDALQVYECKHCGMKSEPPWMTPSPDIALEARDHFIFEHKDCQPPALGEKVGKASIK